MKLNKPVITIFIIIMLLGFLIFFSFLSIGRNLNDKEYISEIVNDFNVKEYILRNDKIKDSIDNFKYPKEVFNYLDDNKIKLLKKKYVNNLFDRKEKLIDKNDVKEILDNSVYEYEYNTSSDIYNYVENDIEHFSNVFENKINVEYIDYYYGFKDFSSGFIYYLILIIIIVSIIILIIFEKFNGCFISSITLILYSFFIYYLNNYILEVSFKKYLNYFNDFDLHLEKLYFICFIFGFVLLLIYIVYKLKKIARNIRISSYNRR